MQFSTDPTSTWQPAQISRKRYERMIDAGIFDDDDKIELLHGVLVAMTPQGIAHQAVIRRLDKLLQRLCGDDADVGAQLPFAASDMSVPEPDLCITPVGAGDRALPDRALLVVEVAETSLQRDRGEKSAIYAAAKVPEYWVVDVKRKVVEIYREPLEDHYGSSRVARPGDRLELLMLPGRFVEIQDVFPA